MAKKIPLTTNGRTGLQEFGAAIFKPGSLMKDWNAGTSEQLARLRENEAASGVLAAGIEGPTAGRTAAMQARAGGELKAGNYDNILGHLVEGVAADENGELGGWGRFGAYVGELGGDALGGWLRASGGADNADGAAARAGALAEAQNSRARAALMGQAGEAADAMNLQNMARTGEMTDAAVANAGVFERGMQGIDMAGIEGSGNMERNLQYGKSRGEAQAEMQYEMMNREAQGLENSMARSFNELSQGKAGAMQQAWGQSIGQSQADLTRLYQDTAAEEMMYEPTANDYARLLADAEAAAAGAPNLPGETEGDPGETDPPPPADAALKTADADLYDVLEKRLAAGQSYESLEQIMTGYNLTDAQKAAIQSGTVRRGEKTNAWRKEWRDKLWEGLGLQGVRNRGGYRGDYR